MRRQTPTGRLRIGRSFPMAASGARRPRLTSDRTDAKGGIHMQNAKLAFALAAGVALAAVGTDALTQATAPVNSGPNPYRTIESFAKMPEGRIWGSTAAVDIDPDGISIWVAERCSAQGFIPPSQMKEGQ